MAIGTEMGEFLVGAYLTVVEECNFVEYNVHPPGGGLKGLDELDVVGLNIETKVAFVCEVTTHIRGLQYKDRDNTARRIRQKFQRQQEYATDWLNFMETHRFMFWSPVVSSGLVDDLKRIRGLELIINKDYSQRIDLLRKKARTWSHDTGNPAFRLFQILEHMRK